MCALCVYGVQTIIAITRAYTSIYDAPSIRVEKHSSFVCCAQTTWYQAEEMTPETKGFLLIIFQMWSPRLLTLTFHPPICPIHRI